MLDHVSLSVPPAQFDTVVAWYVTALAPLGYAKQIEFPAQAVGFGPSSKGNAPFWIGAKEGAIVNGIHVAFKANDREVVHKFHEAAVKAGGTCNGKPGVREHYDPNYYGAFVLDPLG
jgi:hypothetical protein